MSMTEIISYFTSENLVFVYSKPEFSKQETKEDYILLSKKAKQLCYSKTFEDSKNMEHYKNINLLHASDLDNIF